MKVTTERLEHCQINFLAELDAAEVDDLLRRTARSVSRKLNVPGYRRGKAPYQAVLRTFGLEALRYEAVDELGQELYEKALEQIEFKPYQPGELKDVKWDPFVMTVLLPIQPELELGDYRSVRLPLEVDPVTDERVEAFLADLQKEHAQWVPVERPATWGDQVVIDAEGMVGDKAVLTYEGREHVLKEGDTTPLPGFSDQIAGLSAGDQKEFSLAYPEDHPLKDAAGKEATFVVKVSGVKQQDVPALNDELAMMVGAFDTLDALRVSVRESLEKEAQSRAEAAYPERVLDAILAGAVKIDYPPQAVEREVDMALERMERNMVSSGFQLDRYLAMVHKTRESYRTELRPSAEVRVRKRLALVEIAKLEGLKVASEEIDAEVERLTALLRAEDKDLTEFLATPEGRLSVADDLISAKVQERVAQIGKGEAPTLEEKAAEEAEGEAPSEPDQEATAAAEESGPDAAETPAEADQPAQAPAPEPEPVAEVTAGQAD